MTNKTYLRKTRKTHGGYRNLKSYQTTTLIYDLTVEFCKTYMAYRSNLKDPEKAANCLICIIHQANYLLDRQLSTLEENFIKEGGYSENLFRARQKALQEQRTNSTRMRMGSFGGKKENGKKEI